MNPPTSGPAIMASDITAAMMPWYWPRSRGGTRSPMIAMALTIRPPAPRPWSARKAMSCAMPLAGPPSISEPAMPQSAEPIMKMTMEARKMLFLPYRSPILPQMGVETVVPST